MPNRIIKETVCSSETIDGLTDAEEAFFYRLITACDDYGRMDARPAILRARCYPLRLNRLTDGDILDRLRRLQEVGLIERYLVGNQPYLQMITWDKHQQIRAKRPRYPAPADGTPLSDDACEHVISDDITCPRNPIQSESNPNTGELPRARLAAIFPKDTAPAANIFGSESIPFQLAERLWTHVLAHNPKAKVPKLDSGGFQGWCYHADLLMRVDGRDPPEIEAVIDWCQQDRFWHQNVLGMRGFREKYDRLYLGMKESRNPKPSNGHAKQRQGKVIEDAPITTEFRAGNRID